VPQLTDRSARKDGSLQISRDQTSIVMELKCSGLSRRPEEAASNGG
jgi:hypothetical protein